MSLRTIGAIYAFIHTNSRKHNHEKMTDQTTERRRISAAAKRNAEENV